MGGAGSVLKKVGDIGSNVFTLGGAQIAKNNLGSHNPITQALNLPGTILTGGASGPSGMPSLFGGDNNPYVSGPFSLDPNQVANDTNAINAQGQNQYNDTLKAIDTNSTAQQDYAKQTLAKMTPGIEEGLNSQHLLNSSALPQELGRQASYLANDVASQNAQQKQAALTGLQGFQTGGLQRGLSLEDFVNQANVSKSIGAAFAPQAPTGKQNFATTAQGAGALLPLAKAAIK